MHVPPPLKRVSKMPRLLVSHILEPIQHSGFVSSMRRLLRYEPIPSRILKPHRDIRYERQDNNARVADQQTRQRGVIPRGLALEKDIGAGHVTRGVEDEPEPVRERAFRVAGDVGGEDVPRYDDGGAHDVLQPGAADEGPSVLDVGESDAEEAAEGDETDHGEDDAAGVADVGGNESADGNDQSFDGSRGELQKGGVDAAEAVALDQGG